MEILINLHNILSTFTFDPIAINLGPLKISWYSISYIIGILFAWKYLQFLAKNNYELQ